MALSFNRTGVIGNGSFALQE